MKDKTHRVNQIYGLLNKGLSVDEIRREIAKISHIIII